jgi:very-short-patch-repair endonuclease
MAEHDGIVTQRRAHPQKRQLAREFRQKPTAAEAKLWAGLRGSRLGGFHFRCQQVIAGFIVDFYCHRAALVVEIDGSVHAETVEYDAARSAILESNGLHVLRFTNEHVLRELGKVLTAILNACRTRTTPNP